jgi:hypothetical protein
MRIIPPVAILTQCVAAGGRDGSRDQQCNRDLWVLTLHRTSSVTHVTDMMCSSVQHECSLRAGEGGESGIMSTIDEVRAAEKKVQEILDALKKAGPQDPHHLRTELKNATDEYARAVRELNSK